MENIPIPPDDFYKWLAGIFGLGLFGLSLWTATRFIKAVDKLTGDVSDLKVARNDLESRVLDLENYKEESIKRILNKVKG